MTSRRMKTIKILANKSVEHVSNIGCVNFTECMSLRQKFILFFLEYNNKIKKSSPAWIALLNYLRKNNLVRTIIYRIRRHTNFFFRHNDLIYKLHFKNDWFTHNKNYHKSSVVKEPNNLLGLFRHKYQEKFICTSSDLYTKKNIRLIMGLGTINHYETGEFFSIFGDPRDVVSHDESLVNMRTLLSGKFDSMFKKNKKVFLKEAIVLSTSLSKNYMHWMTDFLPRILLFYNDKNHIHIPLLVGSWLHKNQIESITAYNPSIIIKRIDEFVGVQVENFYYVSPPSFMPYNFRVNSKKQKFLVSFSEGFFKNFTSYFLDLKKNNSYDKIYVARDSSVRNISNEVLLIEKLKQLGFKIIRPTKISFKEQVSIFSSARIIVSCGGAALANIIFCNKNAIIGILASDCPDHGFCLFSRLAYVSSRCKIFFMLGSKATSIHQDFKVDIDSVESDLKKWCS